MKGVSEKKTGLKTAADWGDRLDVRFYLAERLKRLQGKKILEIGCGWGFVLREVPDSNEKYGVDLDARRLATAKELVPGAVLKHASMYSLPFKNGFFDAVIMANVIPHVDFHAEGNREKNQRKAFSEAARVLKKGGVLYLTAPNGAWFEKIGVYGKLERWRLEKLLQPYFDFEIGGWNPFPSYPRFIPSRVLKKVPLWFELLKTLCGKGLFSRTSKFFYTEAVRK